MNETQTPATPKPGAKGPDLMVLCPYCGDATPAAGRCVHCRGLLDPLSRQASQNAMGPWFIRDSSQPFRPGCSYETIVSMVRRGKIGPQTVIRGPTTRQFWSIARRTPGVANLLGVCHACQADIQPGDKFCDDCGAGFVVETDRQHLGLAAVHLLPGQATPEAIATASVRATPAGAPAPAPQPQNATSARLVEAAAVRRVLERRLRTQRRVVGALIVLMVLAVGASVWAGFRLVPGSPLASWFTDMEGRVVGTTAPGTRPQPAPPPRSVDAPEPEPTPPVQPEPVAPPSGAVPPAPEARTGAATPAEVPAPAASEASPGDDSGAVWTRIQELVRRDSRQSLAEARELLEGDRPPSVGEADWEAQKDFVIRRLEQLRLRGLP